MSDDDITLSPEHINQIIHAIRDTTKKGALLTRIAASGKLMQLELQHATDLRRAMHEELKITFYGLPVRIDDTIPSYEVRLESGDHLVGIVFLAGRNATRA